ncbi:MAG: sugar phosphate isomerase/epimerase [Armatimonadetes bacterium]|nr:sugar phosphate isomerase/epimerase [Armatimonadota bacterium]
MSAMRVGCQTYSWEMLGGRWSGGPDDILNAVAAAGYAGVEFAASMIGAYYDEPAAFAEALAQRDLVLAAFAYASPHGFTDPGHLPDELAGAERALRFAAQFPRPLLALGGAASPDRDDYDAKLTRACGFYSEVARRGADLGVEVAVHPHSHHGSLLESACEYGRVLDATADSGLTFNPDSGHIVRGGQDLLTCVQTHAARVRHVHVKDVRPDGGWAPLGGGVCDFPALFRLLGDMGYDGWIVAEEESDLAWRDPSEAIRVNRDYLRSIGL